MLQARQLHSRQILSHSRLSATISIFAGAILLFAATMKAQELAALGISSSTDALIAVLIVLELLLGAWLVSGVQAQRARQAAMVTFAIFAIVALHRALSGADSCGCLGSIRLNPWITVLIDLVMIIAFMLVGGNPGHPTEGTSLRGAFASFALVLLPGIALTSGMRASSLDEDGRLVGDGNVVILEPQEWLGKPLPLLAHMDIGGSLKSGEWTVILYRHDCDDCRRRMPEWQRAAGKGQQVALIELPPHAPSGIAAGTQSSGVTCGKLSDKKKWFVATPLVIQLEDGIVRSSSRTIRPR